MGHSASSLALVLAIALAGCGARTGTIDDLFDATVGPRPQPEMCNGLDDDLNTIVDDGFRDELGRYVQLENCGFCGQRCPSSLPHQAANLGSIPSAPAKRLASSEKSRLIFWAAAESLTGGGQSSRPAP